MGWGLPSEEVRNPFIISTDINQYNFKKIRFIRGGRTALQRGYNCSAQKWGLSTSPSSGNIP